MRALVSAWLLVALGVAPPARSSSADLFGLGPRAAGLGGAFTAVADDFSATWYNPAGLALIGPWSVSLGVVAGSPRLWLAPDGLARRDLELDEAVGLEVGLTAPLGQLLGVERLALGMALYAPLGYGLRVDVPAGTEAPWLPAFSDAYGRLSATFGVGWAPLPELAIGIGCDVYMDLGGATVVAYRPPRYAWEEGREVNIDLVRKLDLAASVFAGLLVTPHPRLRLGLAYHMEERADTRLAPQIFDLSGVELDLALHYVNFYQPHQLTLGAYARPTDWLGVSLDLAWQHWSAYRGPHAERPDPTFQDTVVARLGAEVLPFPFLELTLGYFFAPTAVPEQTRGSNFLDANRHGWSLGMTWYLDRMGAPRVPLQIGARVQLQHLEPRHMAKDAGALGDAEPELPGQQISNPGYPGFTLGGLAVHGGVTLTAVF